MKIKDKDADFPIRVDEVVAGECFKIRVGDTSLYYMMIYQDKSTSEHLRCVNIESGTLVLFNPSDEVFAIDIEGVIKS